MIRVYHLTPPPPWSRLGTGTIRSRVCIKRPNVLAPKL